MKLDFSLSRNVSAAAQQLHQVCLVEENLNCFLVYMAEKT